MILTPEAIEARQFTYCQVFTDSETFECCVFVVATGSKPEAKRRVPEVFAKLYPGKNIRKFNVYPKTYVKDARALLAAGLAE